MNSKEHARYNKISAFVGLACNLLLFAAKLTAGLIFGAMAVVADAVNNLSDMGGNIVALIGLKISSMPADREHPYGHARAEYIAAMVVAFIICLLGAELIISAIPKMGANLSPIFQAWTAAALFLSIAVKLGMFFFNRVLSKKTGSLIIKASAIDSLADVFASSAVLISMIIGVYTGIDMDPYMAIAVSVFIIYAGIKLLKEAMTKLLGEGATKELEDRIIKRISSYEGILGIHDLQVHNYGHGKIFASVHVEVDSSITQLESHDIIDKIETDLAEYNLVIHLDPVETKDPYIIELKQKTEKLVDELNTSFCIHDFRLEKKEGIKKVQFDLVIPFECKCDTNELLNTIYKKLNEIDNDLFIDIKIDRK